MKSQSATSNTAYRVIVFWLVVSSSAKLFGLINLLWWIITLPLWLGALVAGIAIITLTIVFGFENENHGGKHHG